MLRKVLIGLTATFILGISLPTIASGANPLGLAVELLDQNGNKTAVAGTGSSLTLLVEPGQTITKVFRIRNFGTVASIFTPSIENSHLVAGVPTLGDATQSDLFDWSEFSPKELVLQPGGVGNMTMQLTIPKGSPVAVHLATLFITDNPKVLATLPKGKDKTSITFRSNIRSAFPMYLGVSTQSLNPFSFKIKNVNQVFIEGKPFFSVTIENNGKLPIQPAGNLKVSDKTGLIKVAVPINFSASIIQPKFSQDVLIEVPDVIPEGEWLVKVASTQGLVSEFYEEEMTLTKTKRSNWIGLALRVLVGLLSLMALFAGWILLRKKRSDKDHVQISKSLEEQLRELHAANSIQKSKKKAPAKKAAPKKKAPAKKAAPKKKAPAKKAAPKRR